MLQKADIQHKKSQKRIKPHTLQRMEEKLKMEEVWKLILK